MPIIDVPSDKDPSTVYQVNTETGTCTCPQFTKKLAPLNAEDGGTRVCKHVQREREKLA